MKKAFWTFLSITAILLSSAQAVYAVVTPSFPTCTNPQGTIKVPATSGVHGIVGSTATYTGTDTVYSLDGNNTVLQCFCSVNGEGIQTDWWKASSLTEEEITILKSEGWHYIPAGNLWGLDSDPYVAKNIGYNCLPTNTGGGSNSPSNNPSTGQTLGTSTGQVLGLATTGNMPMILATFLVALSLIIWGIRRNIRSWKA
jgi:hypothetical protein